MKKSRVDKRREKARMKSAHIMENRSMNDDRRTTGYEILKGVILEAQRLNREARLVPACNSGLTHGNYWILHHLFNCCHLSFFSYCSLSPLSLTHSAHVPLTSHQLFSVWRLAPISTLFSSLLFTISPPCAPLSCLLSSRAFSSRLCSRSCFPWQSAVALFRWARLKRNP